MLPPPAVSCSSLYRPMCSPETSADFFILHCYFTLLYLYLFYSEFVSIKLVKIINLKLTIQANALQCVLRRHLWIFYSIFLYLYRFFIEFILIILVLIINLKLTIQTNALHVFSGDICGFFSIL